MIKIDNAVLIDYQGIDTSYAPYIKCYKQDVIEDIISIGDLPSIENITKFSASVKSTVKDFITTPIGTNFSNIKLTGNVALISLVLIARIEYIANSGDINIYKFPYPKTLYITLPEDYQKNLKITSKIYIEHMNIKAIDNNSFHFSILTLNTINY